MLNEIGAKYLDKIEKTCGFPVSPIGRNICLIMPFI